MNDAVGHIEGVDLWYQRAVESVKRVDDTWNNICPETGSWLRIRACRVQASAQFTQEIFELAKQLQEITGDSLETVNIFIDGMRQCLSDAPLN